MYKFQYFQRRVFFDREQGTLIVRIDRHSDRLLYVPMLIVFTGFFIFICMMCVHALVREFSAETALALSPVMAFISVRSFDSNPATCQRHARSGRNLAQDDVGFASCFCTTLRPTISKFPFSTILIASE
jgi:hypothetical protein